MVGQLVVDVFRDIVKRMNSNKDLMCYLSDVTDGDIKELNYQHGHYQEITNTLIEYNESKDHYDKKYPLIALIEDVRYSYRDKMIDLPNLGIVICYKSEATFRSKDRYKEIINPILMPIYESLMMAIVDSGMVSNYTINHEMFVRPYYGASEDTANGTRKNRANIFNDILDCIEIRNMQLRLYEDVCKSYPLKENCK